jgi:hypothetical protein
MSLLDTLPLHHLMAVIRAGTFVFEWRKVSSGLNFESLDAVICRKFLYSFCGLIGVTVSVNGEAILLDGTR